MKNHIKSVTLLLLMCVSAIGGVVLRPNEKLADQGIKVELESMIPKQFGDWNMDTRVTYQQVSPDVKKALDKIYTQVLTRTYVNSQGYRIMLSIPYGSNQSDDLAAHDPEGCYPAQGFQIISRDKDILQTGLGNIPVRRMEAASGARNEPVTYWFTVGNHAVNDGWERKKVQMKYALNGQIPDGLLVRASSIDSDTKNGYRMQTKFLEALVSALPPESRKRVSGLPI